MSTTEAPDPGSYPSPDMPDTPDVPEPDAAEAAERDAGEEEPTE